MDTFPDFNSDFENLGPCWRSVWDAEESACEITRTFFSDFVKDDQINRSLAPEIQRFFARRRLAELGIRNDAFVQRDIGRNGIAFNFRGRNVRVWKKGPEPLPRAGYSRTKKHFLGQQQYLPFADLEQIMFPNRAILYETDPEFHLRRLWYGLPTYGSDDGPTSFHWVEPITFDMIADFEVHDTRTDEARDSTSEADNLPFQPSGDPESDEAAYDDQENYGESPDLEGGNNGEQE